MVQPRQGLRLRHAVAPPGLLDQPVLAQVFAAFVRAHHRHKTPVAAVGHARRAGLLHLCGRQAQGFLQAGRAHQRLQVVQARQADAPPHRAGGHARLNQRPRAGHHHRGHGATRRMANHHQAPPVGLERSRMAPRPGHGLRYVHGALRHAGLRRQRVVGYHHGCARVVQFARHEAVKGLVQRLPVATVHKNHQRRASLAGGERIQALARPIAVGHVQLTRQAASNHGRLRGPAGEVIPVIRHAHAVVVHAFQPLNVWQFAANGCGNAGHEHAIVSKRKRTSASLLSPRAVRTF